MIVKIPNNNIEERKYIIDILLGEFLGLTFSIEIGEVNNYHIVFEDKELIVEDHFFNRYPERLSYLRKEAIPSEVKLTTNMFIVEENLPILFGEEELKISENKIIASIDIFAASFFMLTRWEEYVNKSRDIHDRFSAKDSLAYKFDFLDRPIVNEYVEMLWAMFLQLGYTDRRKKREYEFVLTHDVDVLRLYKDNSQLLKRFGGDLLKRRSITLATNNIIEYQKVKRGTVRDPYDTFSWLMDLSERANLKSRFYFMSGGVTPYDNKYRIDELISRNLIKEIKEREHIIGFHPSFDAYNNPLQWRKEKETLENMLGQEINEGRQHFLRFEIPYTWEIWNSNRMERDLTLSYADKEGFRCGVCYEFSVFNILSRDKLQLKEKPLIVMEASFMTYQNITPEEMLKNILTLLNKVKKYNGEFVFLWHNSSFNVPSWIPFQEIYEEIINNS